MKLTKSRLREIIREVIKEGFAGPLSKTKQKKFETDRQKSSEVLGFKATGKPDVKTGIGLTENAWPNDQEAKILEKAFKAAGVKVFKVRSRSSGKNYLVDVKAADGKTTISIEVNQTSNVVFMHNQRSDIKLGELKENPRELIRTLKDLKTLPGFGQSQLGKR